ncbi:probable crossover junction endonuclease EME2 [Sorex fumeus]|uniref:probable crossover junction endonuclease EME2 n=1 Tax=Sorex fumeus TaxID=62283 RepID=UPI0024AE40B9|nr:probable crossover junction endonuclease EME2 [Sorex fumeus]
MARPCPEVAAAPEAAPVPPPRARGSAALAARGAGGAASARGARGRRRAPTWEISDSEPEDAPGARAPAEAPRPPRPDVALRRLTVCVDPAVLEDAGAQLLLEALGALGCECLVEPQRQARSLRWSNSQTDPCPQSVPSGWASEEQDVLQLLEPEEFLRGVRQLTQIHGQSCSVPWLCPDGPAPPHLAVIGLDEHLWSCQPRVRETQQPENLEAAAAGLVVGWPEVEEALVLLQLWADMNVLLVASWHELSQHVCAITKALAQRPYKQQREVQAFPFCTAGRWAAGERVARDGSGLLGAWRRQITQFNRVSQPVAEAVVSTFPSPRLLQQAFAACSTEQERLGLLADLPVKVDEDTKDEGMRARRVGPDLARRIFLFFTTTQPDLLLDLGS